MDLVRNLNIRKGELIKTVCSLAGNEKVTLHMRLVYIRDNNEWKYLIGTCKSGDKKTKDTTIEYNDFAFISRTIALASYADFLQDIYDEGYEVAKGFPKLQFEENANWSQEDIIPSHQTAANFPARQLVARIEKNSYFREGKLVGYNQDFYPSARKYIETFIGLDTFHGDQDARKGSFLVDVTDRRGRIDISDNGVLKAYGQEDFCIVGHSAKHEQIKLQGDDVLDLHQADIEDLELWMLKSDGEIIDFRSASERPDRKVERETTDTYLSIIRRGESQHTEFKPYITISKESEPKSDELREAVCALSNHEGGRIFIGVSDNLDIVGIYDKRFYKDYGGTQDIQAAQYISDLKSFLRESLYDNQCFEVEAVSIATKPVIIIEVQKAYAVNYLLHNCQAYIRKGASNAKMSPEELGFKHSNIGKIGTFF
jgi:hypothetical protein